MISTKNIVNTRKNLFFIKNSLEKIQFFIENSLEKVYYINVGGGF